MPLFARISRSDLENVKDLRKNLKTAEPTMYQEMQDEKRKDTPRSESQAVRDYPDPKYHNQKGMVSPLNIIVMDKINSIANMGFDEAISFVIDNIQALNDKYQGDVFYDNFSDTSGGYLRKMEYVMKNTVKPRTIDNLIMYLQNAMMKGMMRLTALAEVELEDEIGNTLMDEFSDKGFVKCKNFNEYTYITEFLFLHDQEFKVININSYENTCTVKRIL